MKRIFFIVCFAAIAKLCISQVKFAVKGGINICNQIKPFSHTYSAGNPVFARGQTIVDFNGGIFTELRLTEKIFLRPQLGVSDQGYKLPEIYDGFGNLVSPERKFVLNYLFIPVHIIYPVNLKFGVLWAGIGPYAAFLLSGHIKTSSSATKISIGNEQTDHFKSSDFGISPTIGLRFNNGLLFGIEQNTGLADVSPAVGKNRNTNWSFYVGFVIK
jgi:Outer membrane protein beta-barrel domain